MLAEIHGEALTNWEDGKPEEYIGPIDPNDQSLIFPNDEDKLKARMKANIEMLDELQLNTTIVHYCESENDFGSLIKKMETPNFKATLKALSDDDQWGFKWQTIREVIKNKTISGDCPSKLGSFMLDHLNTLVPVTIAFLTITPFLVHIWSRKRKKTEQIRMAYKIWPSDWPVTSI